MATAGLVILFGLLDARDVYAWGDTGHQIICEIAFQELNPQARAQVKQLLQHDPDFTLFSKACTWPDHPRKRASEHFVNLSRTATLIEDNPCQLDDRCVVTAIEADGAVLSQTNALETDRLTALKFSAIGWAMSTSRSMGRSKTTAEATPLLNMVHAETTSMPSGIRASLSGSSGETSDTSPPSSVRA
jgi:hypothetical protein